MAKTNYRGCLKADLVHTAPFCAVKVTGALFHTQGGLVIDTETRTLRPGGSKMPNLFAGGGAARGMSGPSRWGYFSGGGLLTAVTQGRLAGAHAAAIAAIPAAPAPAGSQPEAGTSKI